MVMPFPPQQPQFPPQAMPGMGQAIPLPPGGPMGGGALGLPPMPAPLVMPPEDPKPPGPENLQPWQDPPPPDVEHVAETANRDRERFQGYADAVAEMLGKLDLDADGLFASDTDKDDIETFPSPALRIEHDRFCSWGSNHEFMIRAPISDPLDAQEGADKEDAGYYWLDCWKRQHADADNSDLQWSLFDMVAAYGRLATLVTCDFADDTCGMTFRMLDPATTFPFFEGKRGLHHVSMIYGAPASEILGYYGDPEGELEAALLEQISRTDNSQGLETEGEVVEWIDRAWHVVTWNGVEVKYTRHGYGIVPVRYDRGPGGRQRFTSRAALEQLAVSPITLDSPNGPISGYAPRGRRGGVGSERLDESTSGLPFQFWKLRPHRTMEALMGRYLTASKWMTNPSVWVTQTRDAARQGIPDVGWKEGETYTVSDGERAEVPMMPFMPNILQTLVGQMAADQAMGSVGTVAFGMAPPQTTGSAATILDAEGKEIWAPWLRTVQNHVTGVLELAATLYRDWGDALGAPGSRGTFQVPRRKRANSRAGTNQAFELTPEVLRRVGIRFKVEMHQFNKGNLAALGAGILQLQSAGIIGKEDGIRMLGFDPDPLAAMARMREEQLSEAPAVLQADQLRVLTQKVEVAEARGDMESAEVERAKLDYVSFLMAQQEMQKNMMLQSMGLGIQEREMGLMRAEQRDMDKAMRAEEEAMAELEGENMDPGLPPPRPPTEPIIPQGGVASLPQFGISTGTDGGRPQGPPQRPGLPPGI